MKSKIQLRYATKEDVERFYGETSQYSCRAVVAELEGKLVGLGGVYRVGRQFVVFSEIRDEMKAYKKDIIRACRMALEIVNRYNTVVAYCSPEIETAEVFGRHFGFENTGMKNEHGTITARVR